MAINFQVHGTVGEYHNQLARELASAPFLQELKYSFVPKRYCHGSNDFHDATLENVLFPQHRLTSVSLKDFFDTDYVNPESITWQSVCGMGYKDKINIKPTSIETANEIIRVAIRNTGPYNFKIGDNVYLAPPYPGPNLHHRIRINNTIYYTPLTVPQSYIKSLFNPSYKVMDQSTQFYANAINPYLKWMMDEVKKEQVIPNPYSKMLEQFSPHCDIMLNGIISPADFVNNTEATVVDQLKEKVKNKNSALSAIDCSYSALGLANSLTQITSQLFTLGEHRNKASSLLMTQPFCRYDMDAIIVGKVASLLNTRNASCKYVQVEPGEVMSVTLKLF